MDATLAALGQTAIGFVLLLEWSDPSTEDEYGRSCCPRCGGVKPDDAHERGTSVHIAEPDLCFGHAVTCDLGDLCDKVRALRANTATDG